MTIKPLSENDFVSTFLSASKVANVKPILLDCRAPDETKQGILRSAVVIPVSEIEARFKELPKGRAVFIYCRSGGRAQVAASIFDKQGYSEIFVASGCGYEQLKNKL